MSDRCVHFEGVDVQLRFCRGTVASTDRESKPAVDRFKARICTEAVPWEASFSAANSFLGRTNRGKRSEKVKEIEKSSSALIDRRRFYTWCYWHLLLVKFDHNHVLLCDKDELGRDHDNLKYPKPVNITIIKWADLATEQIRSNVHPYPRVKASCKTSMNPDGLACKGMRTNSW